VEQLGIENWWANRSHCHMTSSSVELRPQRRKADDWPPELQHSVISHVSTRACVRSCVFCGMRQWNPFQAKRRLHPQGRRTSQAGSKKGSLHAVLSLTYSPDLKTEATRFSVTAVIFERNTTRRVTPWHVRSHRRDNMKCSTIALWTLIPVKV
jgi:hypothetical protein